MILGGDLGGTKTLLALAEAGGARRIVREARFDSRAYATFDELLAEFLAGTPVMAAVLGVAGPTDGRQADLTYLPWRIDAARLEDAFSIGRLALLNDFAAAAHGLDTLAPEHLIEWQGGQPVSGAPRVILGAGTGLGVAGLLSVGGRTLVVPGEGGHMGFSPGDPEQAALWRHLHERSGRVSVEDVVCGPGLSRIHKFFTGLEHKPEDIGLAAQTGDPAARRTVDLWLAAYGAFAGDLALHWLARGGVFIAGGIAAKLLTGSKISLRPFLEAFNAKREYRALAEQMPIRLVSEQRLGLLGALACGSQMRSQRWKCEG